MALCSCHTRAEETRSFGEAGRRKRLGLARLNADAAKAPGWVRNVAAAKFDPAGDRKFRDYKLGTFGAASEAKRIDPVAHLTDKAARGER